MSAHQTEHGKSDLKVGLTGLGLGVVWILIVATLAFNLAMSHVAESEPAEAASE